MAETPENGDVQKIPPKLTIRPRDGQPSDDESGANNAVPVKNAVPPKTVNMTPPPSIGLTSKKQTSRISLDEVMSGGPASGEKTIRLKPVVSPQAASTPAPAAAVISEPAAEPAQTSEAEATAAKRKTSRISLDSVLGGAPDSRAEGPKTIRLKRPSEAATVKLGQSSPSPAPKAPARPAPKAPAPIVAKKTAVVSDDEEVPHTRRKTIRVKRPAGGIKIKSSAAQAGEDGAADPGARISAPVSQQVKEDSPNWFFLVCEIAAILVVCSTVYVFTAQACGPNASMTELSYGAPELFLSWPGRVNPPR
jgi:hypothetical protein